jgi:hypothetical protein
MTMLLARLLIGSAAASDSIEDVWRCDPGSRRHRAAGVAITAPPACHDRTSSGIERAAAETLTLQPVILDELRDRSAVALPMDATSNVSSKKPALCQRTSVSGRIFEFALNRREELQRVVPFHINGVSEISIVCREHGDNDAAFVFVGGFIDSIANHNIPQESSMPIISRDWISAPHSKNLMKWTS